MLEHLIRSDRLLEHKMWKQLHGNIHADCSRSLEGSSWFTAYERSAAHRPCRALKARIQMLKSTLQLTGSQMMPTVQLLYIPIFQLKLAAGVAEADKIKAWTTSLPSSWDKEASKLYNKNVIQNKKLYHLEYVGFYVFLRLLRHLIFAHDCQTQKI